MPSQHVARTTFDVLTVTCSRRPPFQPPQGVSERGAAPGPRGIATREGPAMQRRTRALPGAFLGARGSAAEGRALASGSWHAFSTARNRHPRSSPRDSLARPPPGPSLRPGGRPRRLRAACERAGAGHVCGRGLAPRGAAVRLPAGPVSRTPWVRVPFSQADRDFRRRKREPGRSASPHPPRHRLA